MNQPFLNEILAIIQDDVGGRGLRTDPDHNLITASAGDFQGACRSLAETPRPVVVVVTGFLIPHAEPPSGETDGPLGALFLTRALTPLGFQVALATDSFCIRALQAGLEDCGLGGSVPLITLPSPSDSWAHFMEKVWQPTFSGSMTPTHLIALERVGPAHTPESLRAQPGSNAAHLDQFLREVPAEHHDRCHTMRGRDITAGMSPAHRLFEAASGSGGPITIGIGDGGNEIGMGKLPWEIIRRNVPGGGLVACRVPVDHLIVCGISNWGAYGLAAGVRLLKDLPPDPELFDPGREGELLRVMVEMGGLVDGVTGKPALAVDGLPFERYAQALQRLGEVEPRRPGMKTGPGKE